MVKEEAPDETWVQELRALVVRRPIVILKLADYEVQGLKETRNGVRQFSLSRGHDAAQGIVPPCICLFFAEKSHPFGGRKDSVAAYLGVLKAKGATTTFDSRLTIRRGVEIKPSTPAGLVNLFKGGKFEGDIGKRLKKNALLTPLGPKESVELIEQLLKIGANQGPLRIVTGGLAKPRPDSMERLQVDAITLAMRAFGLAEDTPATTMNLAKGVKTGMIRLNVLEDAVIEHDGRTVPGYDFVSSNVRGQATFRKGSQTLEVYTANRRKLEEAFGVDLIYVNLFHRSAVLVQYKMLEPQGGRDGPSDWVYREDKHLQKQLQTMRLFKHTGGPGNGFRLSSEAFFFKFVRRRESHASTNILLPLAHFEQILATPESRTVGGNLRVSYKGLDGRYMRQTAFVDLLRAGYIGTNVSTTEHLQALIRGVLSGDDSLVVAVQRLTHPQEQESDRRRQLRELGVDDDSD